MKSILAVGLVGAVLSGCYVMPVSQTSAGGYSSSGTAIIPISSVRAPYTARLYPGNQAASRLGPASGVITSPAEGHGQFTFSLGGETYSGEATRAPNSSRGQASATGNRGGFARCEYTMSSVALGSGSCLFNSGARYDMHITQ